MGWREYIGGSLWSRVASFLLAAAVGLLAMLAAMKAGELPRRTIILGVAGLAVCFAGLLSRRPRDFLLFAWVFSLPYNRNYFSFEGIFGEHGSQGLYWLPSDVFLILLLALWMHQRGLREEIRPPHGRRIWPWLLPFASACVLSTIFATKMEWAAFEMVRIVRVAAILLYVRYNVGRRQWWICIAAIGCAILAQVGYDVLYFFRRGPSRAVAPIFGTAGDQAVSELLSYQAASPEELWHRAAGTTGHPNLLAAYYLLVIPLFLALSAAPIRTRLRWACLGVALLGLAGQAATLSRVAWVLCILELAVLAVGLTATGALRAQRALGLVLVGALVVAVALLPFVQGIERRLTGDLSASFEARALHNRAALRIFNKAPIVGVGLNNYPYFLGEYDPGYEEFARDAEIIRRGAHIRVIAAVHNLYLMVLAETGLLGLATFLVFVLGAFVFSARAIRESHGRWRVASLALAVGIVGVLGQQMMEFTLWVDPILYTFVLVVGMLNNVPSLAASETRTDDGGPSVQPASAAGI